MRFKTIRMYGWATIRFGNTILIPSRSALTTTLISAIISALAAYGFSKIKFKGSNYVFLIVSCHLYGTEQAILVPQFILYRPDRFVRQPIGSDFAWQLQRTRHIHASAIFHGRTSGIYRIGQNGRCGPFPDILEHRPAARQAGCSNVCDSSLHLDLERLSRSADLSAQRQAVHHSARDAEIHLAERRILLADHGGRRLGDTAAPDRVHHRTEERHRWHCSWRRQRIMKALAKKSNSFQKSKDCFILRNLTPFIILIVKT